jgi:ribosome biogenesis protein Nip4
MAVTVKNADFWDIKTQFIPHRKHLISATELSRLMLYKIWGFHGSDYEEFRLLGYKNPVHTSQETHYVSATELSRLMLCKIWGFHGGDYEERRLLGYYVLWL